MKISTTWSNMMKATIAQAMLHLSHLNSKKTSQTKRMNPTVRAMAKSISASFSVRPAIGRGRFLAFHCVRGGCTGLAAKTGNLLINGLRLLPGITPDIHDVGGFERPDERLNPRHNGHE